MIGQEASVPRCPECRHHNKRKPRHLIQVAARQPGQQAAEAVAHHSDFPMTRSDVNSGLQVAQSLAHVQLLKSELDAGSHVVSV